MASSIKIPPGIRLFNKIADFRQWRREILLDRKTLGYVPTMGALHKGHLALVSTAKSHCDHVALTIFVNPAQFAPHEDLSSYPRTLQADLDKLASLGPGVASAVLVPQVEEMYPAGIDLDVSKQKGTFVEVKGISQILEGKTRPAFFRGVTTVVSKFFNIVQPDNAFFGQKDIQQCYVIKSMIRDMHFPIKLEICPTTREEDGLAMSSRNTYLTPSQRAHALVLYNALKKMEGMYAAGEHDVPSLIKAAHKVVEEERQKVEKLNEGWEIKLDYIGINDKSDLSDVGSKLKEGGCVMSGAVYVGKTRLIDNLLVD